MAIDMGGLEMLVRDSGGDELLAKLGLLETKAAKVGAKPVTVAVSAPGAAGTAAAITSVGTSASEASPRLLAVRAALGQVETGAHRHGAAMTKAQMAQSALNQEIAEGTRLFALQARTVDVTSDVAIAELRASAAAQREWLVAIGASTEQQQRFNAAAMVLDARINKVGMQMQHTAGRTRSAGSAIAALAIASSVGGVGLREMATSAGLAGSVMAAQFGPAKWAGYAAGIGVAVIAITTLVGIMQKMREEAAKPSQFSLQQIADIKRLDVAEQVYQQRRLERERLAAEVLSKSGFFATMREQIVHPKQFEELKASLKRAETLEAEALKRAADLRGDILKQDAAATIEITVEGLQARNAAQEAADNAQLAKEAAAFALGQRNLETFHAGRLEAIEAQRQREVSALATRESLLRQPVGGETEVEGRVRIAEADRIASEIAAVNARAGQQTTEEIEARRAKREQLDRQILQFEQREQEVAGDSSKARIAMAEQESIAIARALVQAGVAPDDAERRRQAQLAFEKQRINFEQLKTEATRILEDVAVVSARIRAEGEAAGLSQLEIEQKIAEEERARKPALDAILDRMEAIAAITKNPELLAAIKAMRQGFDAMGKTPLTNFQEQFKALHEEVKGTFGEMGFAAADAFGNALGAGISASLTKGSGKNLFEGFGNALLAGLGNTFMQLGSSLLTYGLILLASPSLAALFPALTLSAGQAIGAGTALIALGAGMGAISANNSGSRTGGGSRATSFRGPDRDIVQHIWLDPDRRVRETARETATAVVRSGDSTATPLPIVNVNQTIIGERDLRAQRQVAGMARRAVRRGIGIG